MACERPDGRPNTATTARATRARLASTAYVRGLCTKASSRANRNRFQCTPRRRDVCIRSNRDATARDSRDVEADRTDDANDAMEVAWLQPIKHNT